MSNVIQIGKVQGFTRMDNDLYEALIGADLSGRELRVALAIHRLTVGYQVGEARIAASVIADMSGISRENVSRILSDLLRQRVVYRLGGSRSPIGIAPSKEWKIDTKSEQSKPTQSVVSDTSKVSFLTHNKERKEITTPDGVVDAPAPSQEKPEKSKRKASFDPLTAKPENVSAEAWAGFCQMRKAKRSPLTARACALIAQKLEGVENADPIVNLSTENAWTGIFPDSPQLKAVEPAELSETGVPVDKIIDLYHRACPNLARVAVESDKSLRALIVERWAEAESHRNSQFWKTIFDKANRLSQVYYRGANVAPRLEIICSRAVFRQLEEQA